MTSWYEWAVENDGFISAVAALMSAIAAGSILVLAWFQHCWNKQHNIALVKPYLTGMLDGDLSSSIRFSIVNKGLGTAIVDKLDVSHLGVVLTMQEFKALLVKKLPGFKVKVGEFNNQYALSPNDEFNLITLWLQFPAAQNINHVQATLLNLAAEISVQVDYHSMLDNTVVSYKSRNDLSILGRMDMS